MIHLILFLLTVASTLFVGGFSYTSARGLSYSVVDGLSYSFPIMSILLAHEMGHYFMSRRYGVPATLPYFIPFPFSPFGTFGAIIKMKGIIINKKALFDIGVAGPLSGFIVSVPFIVLGIKMSKIQALTGDFSYVQLGDPLLFTILQKIMIGEVPKGSDVLLHPFGYAGWVGLFVTALNLLPVGQLDGGHVIYAVFGERSKWVFGASIMVMGALAVFYNPGWLLLVILLLIFGMHHPEPFDMETELDVKRKIIAFIIFVVFILSFTASPFPDLTMGKRGA
jgi:membrane-associated protease RseP (regulator of RpoE activity)